MKRVSRPMVPGGPRKGLQMSEKELRVILAGGTFQLEENIDYTGSASTARHQLLELWRREHGQITMQEVDGAIVVTVVEP